MSMESSNSRRVAIGTFNHREKADAAVSALKEAGFAYSDIGVIAKRTAEWEDTEETYGDSAATGAVAGATAGAGVGGLWALGIAAGVMPAIGPVIAGGLLASVLASAAAGAAAGGVGGALLALGLSEDDANYYHNEVAEGRTVVTVRAGNRYAEAMAILEDHGALLATSDLESPDIAGN